MHLVVKFKFSLPLIGKVISKIEETDIITVSKKKTNDKFYELGYKSKNNLDSG